VRGVVFGELARKKRKESKTKDTKERRFGKKGILGDRERETSQGSRTRERKFLSGFSKRRRSKSRLLIPKAKMRQHQESDRRRASDEGQILIPFWKKERLDPGQERVGRNIRGGPDGLREEEGVHFREKKTSASQ